MQEWKYQKARDQNLSYWQKLNSVNRELSLITFCLNMFFNLLCKYYLKIFHRLEIIYSSPIPTETPFILVANHSSHLDTLCLISTLNIKLVPCILPIAAADYFFNTHHKSFLTTHFINALPLWRKNKELAVKDLQTLRERILEGNCGYIIFPEGSRTRDGKIHAFKAGIGVIVATTAIPIIPCYIMGAFDAFPPNAKFPKFRKIKVYVGNPLTFQHFSNEKKCWKEISEIIHDKILELEQLSA